MGYIVFKHQLKDPGWITELQLARRADIKLFGTQSEPSGAVNFFLWEGHDSGSSDDIKRSFLIVPTGLALQESLYLVEHLFSIQTGRFVWHLMEVVER